MARIFTQSLRELLPIHQRFFHERSFCLKSVDFKVHSAISPKWTGFTQRDGKHVLEISLKWGSLTLDEDESVLFQKS